MFPSLLSISLVLIGMPLSFWLMLVSVGEVFYPTTLLKKIVSILVVNGFLLEFLPQVLENIKPVGKLVPFV